MKTWLGVLVAGGLSVGGCASQKPAAKTEAPAPVAEAPAAPPAPAEAAPEKPAAEAAPSESKAAEPKAVPRVNAKGALVVDGRPLVLVGQGARVKDGVKLYDMQMWIDEEDGRRAFPALAMRAGGRDKARLVRGDHAPGFLVWGRFTKVALFRFAKAVPAATMRDDVKSALEEVKGADAAAALFAVDAEAGDEWVLTTRDNGEIELATGAGKDDRKDGPQSPKLQRALWNVWLGARPLSVELRRQLIEKIDLLGR
ncbi:MAG TPA: hypothetical protein VGL86_04075 [Polyangia bacterium]